jgi:uncharacterized phiE125 gp8 family phage protein
MHVAVITPPAPVITLAEAKMHLRVDHTDDDALIARLVAAATQHVSPPTGWLGRSLGVQTLELSMVSFHEQCRGNLIALPFRPIVEVESVKYLDQDGAETTLATDQWRIVDDHMVAPVYNGSWPAARRDHGSVKIRYVAGYPDTDGETPVRTVPEKAIVAILLYVGAWYENREEVVAGVAVNALPPVASAEALLSTLRIWSL